MLLTKQLLQALNVQTKPHYQFGLPFIRIHSNPSTIITCLHASTNKFTLYRKATEMIEHQINTCQFEMIMSLHGITKVTVKVFIEPWFGIS